MYQPVYQHRRPKRMGSYFLPFLSLIILGLIGVLVFQIVSYFQDKAISKLENKASVKIVAGRADMKIWGVDQWTTAIDGSILNEGDQVRTAPGSRVILTLLNGSVVRLNSDTEVELAGLKSRDGEDEASFALKNGELWLRHSEKNTVKTTFAVKTANMNVQALGTTFDVLQSDSHQSAHVVDGKVKVDFMIPDSADTSKTRVADTLEVALGQEVSIGNTEIDNLKNQKPIDVLSVLADDFRNSEWYTWNSSQDSSGQVGVSVADAVGSQTTPIGITGLISTETTPVTPAEVSEVVSSGSLTPPIVVSPSGSERTTKSGEVTILGTTDSRTDKVEVTSYDANGKADPYILSKYISGSTNWSYLASNQYGNLRAGDNRFVITAIAKDGTRSESTSLTITYDKPKQSSDLSAPTIVSFNGESSSEVTADSVKVVGKIGKGISKIFVNDFVLTQYVMDSGTWVYFAKASYGNLNDGENSYQVYGVDIDGKKTPITKFTITKTSAIPENPPLPTEAPVL